MENDGTSAPGGAPRPKPEPSWPTVIATTARLWLERHPVVIGRWKIRLRLPATAAPSGGSADTGPRRRVAALVLAAGVLVVGTGAVGLLAARHSAHWDAAAAIPAPVGPMAGAPRAKGGMTPLPVSLTIPAVGVQTKLITLGLTADGRLQVPSSTAVAGWYTGGPRPGAIGPAVIAGHVDSRVGPGVFFHLSQLQPGDKVYVRRADGTLAAFRVTIVRSYAKDTFPTAAVYGPTPDPELRLITCGGAFDSQLGSYLSNTVVYATQVKGSAS